MVNHYTFNQVQISAFQKAKAGNETCGDSYLVLETKDYFVCGIADGLGSGEFASESAEIAISILKRSHHFPVDKMMDKVNEGLKGKRGAVLAVFKFEYKNNQLFYCGIGNINLIIYSESGAIVRPLSYGGYLAGKPQTYHVKIINVKESCYFHMYSDGVNLSVAETNRILKTKQPKQVVAYLKEVVASASDDITYIVGKIQ